MAHFCYFHPGDNVAPNAAATIQTGTADSAYPVANATDLSYAKIAAPSKLTGVTGAWLFDFGSAQRVDAVVLWHNFDAALAVSLQGNAANSWGGPTVNAALTIPAKRADDYTVKVYKDLTGVTGYSAGGFRYWRLNVSGSNSVPAGIKILLFSRIRTTVRNINYGVVWSEHQVIIDMSTDALVPWAYDMGAAPRQLRADMLATSADITKLREWFRACGGRASPTVLVPDAAVNDAWLCRWSQGGVAPTSPALGVSRLDVTQNYPDLFTTAMSFDEITAGDPEWI